MSQQILSVSQINDYIRDMMDRDQLLTGVAVRGEISNYKLYPSGHHYFTLKDESGALKCVMFRGNAMRLRFRPENGMQIIAVGKITVYPRDGAYQLYVNAMALDGVGDLHTAFEQLKKKLSAQGLFDPSHKKPIPQYPKTIGIVSSAAGAAIHDMLRILKKRYPLAQVKLLPVRVQGEEAAGEIAAAIRYANHHQLADLLIVGRGGGSIEDLWAFNEEPVAYAIYESEIPVISAVGHEPDVTISDYVADLRAATPSNAAELAVPDQDALRQTLDTAYAALSTGVQKQLHSARQHLRILSQSAALQSPDRYVMQRRTSLSHLEGKLLSLQQKYISQKKQRFIALTATLDAMSPLKILTRGYAMTTNASGAIIRSVKQIQNNDSISITVSDGVISATVDGTKENDHG